MGAWFAPGELSEGLETGKAEKAVIRVSCLVFRDPNTLAGGTAVAPRQLAFRPGLGKAVIRVSCLVFRDPKLQAGGTAIAPRRLALRPLLEKAVIRVS